VCAWIFFHTFWHKDKGSLFWLSSLRTG
jgi:hypothetical protein